MSCFRFLTTNYVDLTTLANTDVSSEQAAFPVTNAYNANRRSKVWRSNGYFKVVAGANTIVFRDDASTNLTATVTAGEYNSTATFMAAVDAALEAVGAANYTVTQDTTTLHFVITSDLSGGATAFKLIWTHANSAGMAALMGFSTATDDTGASTYYSDYLRIHSPNEWILWDMGISSNPDSFVLIGPRNSPIKISPSATIKLEGSNYNAFGSPEYSTTLTYDDEVICKLSNTGFHTTGLRYWRLSIMDQENANGYVEVGAFFLGTFYAPTQGRAQFPFQSNLIDRSTTVYSESGSTYSDIREQSQGFTVSWKGLTKTEIEDVIGIFRQYGTAKPFFVSMDTDAVFSSSQNKMLKFVKFDSTPSYSLVSPNLFELSTSFREEL